MANPLSLDLILSEFNENSDAWVLQDIKSKRYVTIPHSKYPGRNTIHFFLIKSDAELMLMEILDVNVEMKKYDIFPISVKLKRAIRGIAADNTPENADSFAVHTPNEVFEFIRE